MDEQSLQNIDRALLDLFTSRVRIKILRVFLTSYDKMFYVREVTRMIDEEVNAVRRELERLKAIGLLATEKRANRLYYKVRRDFPYYYDLLRMIGKSTGFAQKVRDYKDKLGVVKFVMFSTAFVQGMPADANRIDAMFVGQFKLETLQALVREHEELSGREINYTVMTEEEFEFRKKRNDAFIREVLSQPQVVVIGDEVELNA